MTTNTPNLIPIPYPENILVVEASMLVVMTEQFLNTSPTKRQSFS